MTGVALSPEAGEVAPLRATVLDEVLSTRRPAAEPAANLDCDLARCSHAAGVFDRYTRVLYFTVEVRVHILDDLDGLSPRAQEFLGGVGWRTPDSKPRSPTGLS